MRHNKRGLLDPISHHPQKKYKKDDGPSVQITAPVSKFNFVDPDKSGGLMKMRQGRLFLFFLLMFLIFSVIYWL